jgi:DNA-directed RNA polymerase specialized sigma24 family protein
MADPRRQAEGACPSPYPGEGILQIYAQVVRLCVLAGLSLPEAQDLAQDIWVWLLRNGSPVLALTAPWLASVVHNFVMRYRRRKNRRGFREGLALDRVPEPQTSEHSRRIESNELLDRVAAVLPETERRLLALVRGGYTLAEAARLLKIPRGSRSYFGGRLIDCARREMQRRGLIAPKGFHSR